MLRRRAFTHDAANAVIAAVDIDFPAQKGGDLLSPEYLAPEPLCDDRHLHATIKFFLREWRTGKKLE